MSGSGSAPETDEALLASLRRIAAEAEAAEVRMAEAVGRLRRRYVTWAVIGEALGVTASAVCQRFRKKIQ